MRFVFANKVQGLFKMLYVRTDVPYWKLSRSIPSYVTLKESVHCMGCCDSTRNRPAFWFGCSLFRSLQLTCAVLVRLADEVATSIRIFTKIRKFCWSLPKTSVRFKLTHVCIQVTRLHEGDEVESISKIF